MLRRKHGKAHTFFSPNRGKTWKRQKMTYRKKSIDSVRFLANSLSSVAKNLPEGPHNSKCKDCKSCLEYVKVR